MPKTIIVPAGEEFDPKTNKVTSYPEYALRLEHSLISISEWEAKWHVSFFDSTKTEEQTLSYIECMTLNKNVDPSVYRRLNYYNIRDINEYIVDPMTATTIREDKTSKKRSSERVTSELIYYWMIAYNIPVQFEKWHINRLIMLIRVCSEKQKPAKKRTRREIMEENRALNMARRAKLGTKG